jgi:HEAT repeat protein
VLLLDEISEMLNDARCVAGFADPSALLKHELAYCLGQSSVPASIPVLESVLRNKSEDPMVRHEAAEALGALSASQSVPLLKQYLETVSSRPTRHPDIHLSIPHPLLLVSLSQYSLHSAHRSPI